jgi:hypothetical protein
MAFCETLGEGSLDWITRRLTSSSLVKFVDFNAMPTPSRSKKDMSAFSPSGVRAVTSSGLTRSGSSRSCVEGGRDGPFEIRFDVVSLDVASG